jgi:hypothetical protein
VRNATPTDMILLFLVAILAVMAIQILVDRHVSVMLLLAILVVLDALVVSQDITELD